MKMLGQDLHTQEEFDRFKITEFDPVVQQLQKTRKWLIGLTLTNIVLFATDIIILLNTGL